MCKFSDNIQAIQQLRDKLPGYKASGVVGDYPRAGVLVGITADTQQPELVLTLRASHLNKHSGEVAFPGGMQESQDPDLLSTALREANEEVGLNYEEYEHLGLLTTRLTNTKIAMSPYVGFVSSVQHLKANPNEIEAIFTVPLVFFSDPDNLYVYEVERLSSKAYVPEFRYEGYAIFGATAMVIVELMNSIFDSALPWRSVSDARVNASTHRFGSEQ